MSEKKTLLKDYKINNLAVGCYYFKDFKYFEYFFNSTNFKKNSLKKEIYIINLIDFLIKQKIKINFYKLKKFVHLGTPYQYENFIYWKNILDQTSAQLPNNNFSSTMLIAGKGNRVKKLGIKKPFLKFKKQNAYEFIFDKFNSKQKFIITNKFYINSIKKKFKKFKINKTNSMIETIDKSSLHFQNKKNFFILSCDCYGNFKFKLFKKQIKVSNPDIVVFAFKISEFQKRLSNSHTTLEIFKNKIKAINVKKFVNTKNEYGHAGFFWFKNGNLFKHLDVFKSQNNLKRELIIDDYFKFLFDRKIYKFDYFMLDQYVHLGSIKEYQELKYWENYFANVH